MKRIPLLSALVGLAALVAVALLPVSVPQGDDVRIANTAQPSPLAKGVMVSQEFPATGGTLTSLGVLLGTYKRINQGTLTLTLAAQRGGVWQTLATETFAKEMLRDSEFMTVTFTPPLAVKTREMLRLTLQSPDRLEDAVAWWTSPDVARQGFSLSIDGQPQMGAASFAVTYTHSTGRLFQMVGPIWGRLTLFLDPGWRFLLLVGLAILAITFLVLSVRLFSGMWWAAPPVDAVDQPKGVESAGTMMPVEPPPLPAHDDARSSR